MRSNLAFIIAAGILTSSPALAQSAASSPPAEKAAKTHRYIDRILSKLDKNKDSLINRDEAGRLKWLSQHFDAIDSNKDGSLNSAEMQTHHAAMREQHHASTEIRFKAADKDGDAALTKPEAEAGHVTIIVHHFEEIDASRDGKVTQDELRSYLKRQHDAGSTS